MTINCSRKSHISNLGAIQKGQSSNTIYLKSGIFKIDKPIVIEDDVTIIADSTTLLISEQCPIAINLRGSRDITIIGLTIQYEKKPKQSSRTKLEHYNYLKAIDIFRSSRISLKGVHLYDMPYKGIRIEGSKDIIIEDCLFENLGLALIDNSRYSVDGIFIGGKENVENVRVLNCDFQNIGNYDKGKSHQDADGIHLQSTTNLSKVTIENCMFYNCGTRGIKIQSGEDIEITNSSFELCKSAISASMAHPVNRLNIENNIITNCFYPFGSNSIQPLVLSNLKIRDNTIDKCENFFRTNGKSDVNEFEIVGNKVQEISTSFMIGRFTNGIIKSNVVEKYATSKNKSLNMAILLSPECKNIEIIENDFGKTSNTDRVIVNRSKSKTIKAKSNK